MSNPVCLQMKDYKNKYICNQSYEPILKKQKHTEMISYEIVADNIVSNMKDLIKYCLTYNIEVDIPKEYEVITLYNILFCTGNFEPEDREHSFCRSSVVYTCETKSQAKKTFERMCKSLGRKPMYKNKNTFCWQTEDFAVNQIVHCYSLSESYLIEEKKQVNYEEEVIKIVSDMYGFCRKDVLNNSLDKIRRLYEEEK